MTTINSSRAPVNDGMFRSGNGDHGPTFRGIGIDRIFEFLGIELASKEAILLGHHFVLFHLAPGSVPLQSCLTFRITCGCSAAQQVHPVVRPVKWQTCNSISPSRKP